MDKELKDEIIRITAVFAAIVIATKIIFYRQDIITTTKTGVAVFWLFVLPGFMLMRCLKEKADFATRIIAGTALGIAVVGVIGYNLGAILGISFAVQAAALPALCIVLGFLPELKKKGKRNSQNQRNNS